MAAYNTADLTINLVGFYTWISEQPIGISKKHHTVFVD